jgi:hypothetical protein
MGVICYGWSVYDGEECHLGPQDPSEYEPYNPNGQFYVKYFCTTAKCGGDMVSNESDSSQKVCDSDDNDVCEAEDDALLAGDCDVPTSAPADLASPIPANQTSSADYKNDVADEQKVIYNQETLSQDSYPEYGNDYSFSAVKSIDLDSHQYIADNADDNNATQINDANDVVEPVSSDADGNILLLFVSLLISIILFI